MSVPVSRSLPRFVAPCAVLVVCCLQLTLSSQALALTVHHTYRFETSQLVVGGGPEKALQVDGWARTWERGEPEIPYDVVTLIVPQGMRPVAVRAHALAEQVLFEDVALAMAAPLQNDDGAWSAPKDRRPMVAGAAPAAGAGYPPVVAEPAGSGSLHGYQLASVRVYPVHYDAGARRVVAFSRLDLEIELAQDAPQPLERQRFSPAIEVSARRSLEGLVANPEAIDGYSRRIGRLVEKAPGGFAPTNAPSLEGSDVDYVIITSDALASTWQTLADWKTLRGVPTVVRTVEWVQANYRRGSDVQETIRTFVQDAYAKWGVQYVLLGGDTDILPARYGYSNFGEPTERDIPSDMYFACLDGNWNQDGDALWGEAAISAVDPGDNTDFYAEVFVGRVALSTTTKVSNFITKLISYENPTNTTYQNELLLLGEVLFPVNWDSGQAISMDGGSFCQEMAGYATGCVTITRLYENFWAYPGASKLTRANATAEMNAGCGIVNHIGHGYRYNMSCGDLSFQNNHALALTNAGKLFVLYMLNCTATAYDFPCLAEAFLEASNGAVAVLGASRAAYALPSRNYNKGFFEALYTNGYFHIGETFVRSRLAQTPNAWFDTADHYSHLLYNFLGDPEMVIHTCTIGTTVATYSTNIGLGLTNLLVNVTVGGVPRAGALVCMQKGTEEYEFGLTDASGNVTIPFRAESAGSVSVTVSGQNMKMHLGTINVSAGAVAYVSTQSLTVDDDTSGSSNGNGNGFPDAGETVELSVTFRNNGTVAASSVNGVLRIPSPWATVLDSTYSLGTVNAGGTATATNQVHFSIPAATPDGTVLPLTFVTTSGVSTWTDVVNKVVRAPILELVLLDVDDYAPGGNGDGVVQAGETFDLVTVFKNFGTGAANGLTATLTSTDPDVTITNGAISVGTATPLVEATGATRFRLSEAVIAENPMTIQTTDNRGRVRTWNITLRGPVAPAAPTLDASTGANTVVVEWTPSTVPDLAGYHVYRATSGSGPWTRATIDYTRRVAYFRNTGLNPSTRYYFQVTAIDSSGNESTPSTTTSINTNPAQLSGWPIGLEASSSCPVAVGDITGDGSKEIVAGNDHLYAWNNNGLELRDDDGDPQSWGVFAVEVNVITGAVVLAEMQRSSPGFEVFVASWEDSNKTFAVRGDGSFLPGWPQKPDPTSAQKGYWGSPAAMDVDGDGLAELFAPAKNGNLYAWHWNGTPLGAQAAFKSGLGTWSRSSPSFANVDSDPYPEIIYGSPTGVLHIWNSDGSNHASFPKTPGILALSSTAIGDINRDGILDVVFITEGGAVNVYNTKTGNQLPGWPQSLSVKSSAMSPSPALADFNNDGYLEIVVANNHAVASQSAIRVYNYLGATQPGWPITPGGFTSESSPIVADVSGDGQPDILFGNEGGLLYGWNFDGTDIAGFPLSVGDFIRSTPYADDVDSDGDIDLVLAGWDKNVYIWDFPAPYLKTAAQWPTFKHDMQRSGQYGYRIFAPTDSDDPQPELQAPPRPTLAQNYPNPFNPTTSIRYGVPTGAGLRDVRIEIFDVSGSRVRRLVHGRQAPGSYNALWDGRDDQGRAVHSGVFFYRLQVAGETLTRKMMLLK